MSRNMRSSTRENPRQYRNRDESEESDTPNPPSESMRLDHTADNSETLHLVPIEHSSSSSSSSSSSATATATSTSSENLPVQYMEQPQVDMADEEAGIIQMGNVVEPQIRKRSADQIEQPQIHNLFNMRDICVLKDHVNEDLVTRFYNQSLQPHYSATWEQVILPDALSRSPE